MKPGIIGYGHVGKALHKLFSQAVIYDEPLQLGARSEINHCELAFVCVPTPMVPDGKCDTTIVEDVIRWLQAKVIVICSTVPVGFTDGQKEKTGKRIVFNPEYYGETAAHPFADLERQPWITLGGDATDTAVVVRAYQHIYNADIRFYLTDAKTAEMAKYMTNCFLALKVTFCNEMFDVAKGFGIEYNDLREVWLADPRIGRSHTFVYEDQRGFSGKCLPKDLSSLISQAEEKNINIDLLKAVRKKNQHLLETQ